MNLNKKIAKTMVFALALSSVPFFGGQTAKAAAPTGVEFDGEAETIKVGDAKFWAIVKSVKDEKKADLTFDGTKHFKVDSIEVVNGEYIDVSNLKKTKELNIVLGTADDLDDAASWQLLTIPAQVKDLKAYYITDAADSEANKIGTPDGGFLVLKKNKASVALPGAAGTYMAKIGNGSWDKFETVIGADASKVGAKLEGLAQLGATISIREAGKKGAAGFAWASKEAKVKLSPRSKAPSVKIDSSKGTVSVKKGMEFLVPAAATGVPTSNENFKPVVNAKNTLKDVDLNITENKHFLVRMAATKKKLASKIADITVKFQAAPEAADAALTAEGGAVAKNVNVKTKVPYNISKGATITNETATDYEFYVSPKGTEIDNPKWTKLKAQTTKRGKLTPTVVSLKYSKDGKDYAYIEDNANTHMFIRVAGGKQEGNQVTLASAPLKVKLPLAKVAQAVEVSGVAGVAVTEGSTAAATATIATAKPGSTYKIAVQVSNIHSAKAPSLKVKTTKNANGVSIKGAKFNKGGNAVGIANIEVKLSKNIFKNTKNAVAELEYSVEGVKGKITVKINKE